MTAMFLTIFIGQWVSDSKSGNRTNSRESHESHSKHQPSVIPNYLFKHLPEIIGVIGSLLSLVVFGPEKFILPAMGIILLALILARPILDDPSTPQNRKEES